MKPILGIDPSLTATGFSGFCPAGFGKMNPVISGCITHKKNAGDFRLCAIREQIAMAIANISMLSDELHGIVGIEENFVRGRGVRSALLQREAIAVCIEVSLSLGWKVIRVAPTEAKAALGLAGGKSTKRQMIIPASRLYPTATAWDKNPIYRNEAIADSIGVALVAVRGIRKTEFKKKVALK
jgi:Holliday junction resolvasome RuvABC endonuclease subunit